MTKLIMELKTDTQHQRPHNKMEPIKASTIIENIRSLASQYPDAIYDFDECFYNKGKVTNGPEREGCIVGQAMDLDIDVSETFRNLVSNNVISVLGFDNEIGWINYVQEWQDCGLSWSESVKRADYYSDRWVDDEDE